MTDIRAIVREAVTLVLAERPVPSTVTIAQAAEMLEVSQRTIHRMNPPRSAGGRIPYSWIVANLKS